MSVDSFISTLQVLNCGHNCTGFSSVLSITKKLSHGDQTLAMCLINAGDSCQKFCSEYKVKLNKLTCVLLTSLVPHNVSGLPALLLSLSDIGHHKLAIIGPPGLTAFIASLNPFTNRRYPELTLYELNTKDFECKSATVFRLEWFTIEVLPVFSCQEGTLHPVALSACITPWCVEDKEIFFGSVGCISYSQSYHIEPAVRDVLGLFQSQYVILALFVPLQYGGGYNHSGADSKKIEAVKRYFENICVSRNVVGIYVDLCKRDTSVEFRHATMSLALLSVQHAQLAPNSIPNFLASSFRNKKDVDLRGCGIDNDDYFCWKETNRENIDSGTALPVEPLMTIAIPTRSSEACSRMLSHEQFVLSTRRLLSPCDQTATMLLSKVIGTTYYDKLMSYATLCGENTGDSIQSSCNRNLLSGTPFSNYEAAANVRSFLKRKRGVDRHAFIVPYSGCIQTEFLFLGTGSAAPSKYRCNSSILLTICNRALDRDQRRSMHVEKSSILLDAGESCLSQLYCALGCDLTRMNETLASLAVVWISHQHADHHCGLALLLEEVLRVRKSKTGATGASIVVVASNNVIRYHEFLACIGGYADSIEFVPIEQTAITSKSPNFSDDCFFGDIPEDFCKKINLKTGGLLASLISVPVNHCHDSYGVVLRLPNGNKFVYSADCRPCSDLIVHGKNCDVLIHESTFDDDHSEDAIAKRHCTCSEALTIGLQMQAKHVVLTHFSQRYPRFVNSGDTSSLFKSVVEFSAAFDFMKFSFPFEAYQLPSLVKRCGSWKEVNEDDTFD